MNSYQTKYVICFLLGIVLLVLSVIGFITASKVVDAMQKSEHFFIGTYDKDGKPTTPSADLVLSEANKSFTDRGASVLGMISFCLFLAMYRIWICIPAALLILIGIIGYIKNRQTGE